MVHWLEHTYPEDARKRETGHRTLVSFGVVSYVLYVCVRTYMCVPVFTTMKRTLFKHNSTVQLQKKIKSTIFVVQKFHLKFTILPKWCGQRQWNDMKFSNEMTLGKKPKSTQLITLFHVVFVEFFTISICFFHKLFADNELKCDSDRQTPKKVKISKFFFVSFVSFLFFGLPTE